MDFQYFLYEVRNSILILTINRPEKRNAWTWPMHIEYLNALKAANKDDAVQAVILTGAPPAFSAGTDLGSFEDGSTKSRLEDMGASPAVFMREFKKPLIAAINGAAIGMGLTMTLMCDIRMAAESATMSMRFTHVGVIPEFASPYMLPRIVGLGRAMELCLTARIFDADEALRMGLVTHVVPDDRILPAALEIARDIVSKKVHAVRKTKEILYRYLDTDFYESVRREAEDFISAVQQSYN